MPSGNGGMKVCVCVCVCDCTNVYYAMYCICVTMCACIVYIHVHVQRHVSVILWWEYWALIPVIPGPVKYRECTVRNM